MNNKTFKMCVNASNIASLDLAIEQVKDSLHYKAYPSSFISAGQIPPRQPFLSQIWFEITYSREFLIFLLGQKFIQNESTH